MCGLGLYCGFLLGVFVCRSGFECLRRRCCQPVSHHTNIHTLSLPYLHDVASSTGRPAGGATHVLTLPWQPLSSPCPPLHTHRAESLAHAHQPQVPHMHSEFLGLHPVQDKLNLHALPAIFKKSIQGSSFFQITLGGVRNNHTAFLPSQSHKNLCSAV